MLGAAWQGWLSFPVYMVLAIGSMFAFGLMFSNFTALAMEPQGHIAGTASSLFGSITTLLGSGVGALIGQDFNGTMLPFTTGAFLCTMAAFAMVIVVERGRLFMPHNLWSRRRRINPVANNRAPALSPPRRHAVSALHPDVKRFASRTGPA